MNAAEDLRRAAVRPLDNRARRLKSEWDRWEQRRAEAEEKARLAETELHAIHVAECERFGRQVPLDAFVLDVLGQVDVEPGDVWRWRGMFNNKGLPVVRGVRFATSEGSVTRYLAIEFGVIAENEYGLLYPLGATDDVNPWHRRLRASVLPIANPGRFTFGASA